MKANGYVTLFFFVLLSAVTAAGQEQKIEGIAAVVETEIILYSDLIGLAEQEAVLLQIDKTRQPLEFLKLVNKWLTILLDEKAQIILAKNDTTVIIEQEEIDAQVEQEVQNYIQGLGSEAAVVDQFKMTMQKLRDALTTRTEKEYLIQRLKFQVTKDVTVTRTEIEAFFDTFKDSIPAIPKIINISHLLISPTSAPEIMEVKGRFLDSLGQLIKDGADFAELAGQHSEDPGSASNGGDLGWQKPGSFFPEFEAAVAELDSGEISGLVKSPVGYHLIQLLGRRGVEFHTRHILSFLNVTEDDVKRTVDSLNVYRQRALNGEDFSELAFIHSDDPDVKERRGYLDDWDLENLAERLPEFKQNIENLKEGDISEPFQTQFGYHIVKINKLTESRDRDIVTDYEFIRDIALNQKQNEYFSDWFIEKKSEMYIDIKVDLGIPQEAQIDTGGTVANYPPNRNYQLHSSPPDMFPSLREGAYTNHGALSAINYSLNLVNSQRRKFVQRQKHELTFV